MINAPSYALTGRPLIAPVAPGTPATPMSQNLLVNPGFEVADPSVSGYSGVTIPGWTVTGTPTVIPYATPRPIFPSPLSSPLPNLPKFLGFPQHAPSGGGNNFAGGGPVATSTISQTVNLTGAAGTPYTLSADLGGRLLNPSSASVQVTFSAPLGPFWAPARPGRSRCWIAWVSPSFSHARPPGRSRWAPPPRW